jgi:mannose-6-phosphate isomerase
MTERPAKPETPPVSARPYRLLNQIQPYEWGTRGGSAYIPRLLGIVPKSDEPCAELWMGAHPKAPSHARVGKFTIPLDEWIAAHPDEILGQAVAGQFEGCLPFLFKVLSAGEALSIQAHPNKQQAEQLHASDPQHYPDDNHKPEIAVALDELTALLGLKPVEGLQAALRRYPEIAWIVGPGVANAVLNARPASDEQRCDVARLLFMALLKVSVSSPDELANATGALAERLQVMPVLSEQDRLFIDLSAKYREPDAGLFSIYLLNLVHLKAGQGVFIRAGVPHAYLKGNIIECMANSDNVVRVGLTPKFKDAEAMMDILECDPQPIQPMEGSSDAAEVVYPAPVSEFQVSRIRLKPGEDLVVRTGGKPEVLLLTYGGATLNWPSKQPEQYEQYGKGETILVPALLSDYRIGAMSNCELFRVTIPI